MKTSLIGHSGFVGSNLLSQITFTDCYNSKNIDEIRGKEFDELICAGVPGTKWIANKNPKEDKLAITKLFTALKEVKVKRAILISTIDVYKEPNSGFNEDHEPCELPHYSYGLHRRKVEYDFRELFKNSHIIRLPALFGQGLKKNPIYDLLNAHFLENMNPSSVYQWYYLKHLSKHIEIVKRHDLELVNLFTEPLSMREIIERFFGDKYKIGVEIADKKIPDVNYSLKTKHARLFSREKNYVRAKEDVLGDFEDFLRN